MTKPTRESENSVLFALGELQAMEQERIEAEASAKIEAARAKKQALEDAARAEEERQLRIQAEADAAAKLRVEADKEIELEKARRAERIDALKAELESVQAERARLHSLAIGGAMTSPAPKPSRLWPTMFAAASALAMVLGTVLVVRPPEVIVREVEVQVPVPVVAESREAPAEALEVEAPVEVEVEEAAPETTRPAIRRPRPRPQVRPRPDTLSSLDECDSDDPLCGI